jgi:biopolymer transport protein ExbB/TolQ
MNEILHYLRVGGFTIAFILAASVLALVVAFERAAALWGVGDKARQLGEVITKHLLRGDFSAARSAAERSVTPAADIFLVGFDRADKPRAAVEAAVERERQSVLLKLKRNLWVLGTIGATTPFVGLFGTVAGIMRSFRDLGLDVQAGGSGGPGTVMTGISEALVATAAGILVAVEAVVLYNYFQAKLARVSVELKLLADEFVEVLKEPQVASSSPSAQATPLSAVSQSKG